MEERLLDKYCAGNPALLALLIHHTRQVADRAALIVERHPELHADLQFVRSAAMLHDIGVVQCDAPGIHCFGTEPYMRHGLLGAAILRAEGLPLHARVAERHTGTGLTVQEIQEQNLPLPLQDFSPETIEEQIVCYADEFYSKSHPERVKTPQQVLLSLHKYGQTSIDRFTHWMQIFE